MQALSIEDITPILTLRLRAREERLITVMYNPLLISLINLVSNQF